MMPHWAAGILLLACGAVLLCMAYRGHVTGQLRAGRTLSGPYTPNRDDNPLGFYAYLALYLCFGIGLCVCLGSACPRERGAQRPEAAGCGKLLAGGLSGPQGIAARHERALR
jgi:hypothetical protein